MYTHVYIILITLWLLVPCKGCILHLAQRGAKLQARVFAILNRTQMQSSDSVLTLLYIKMACLKGCMDLHVAILRNGKALQQAQKSLLTGKCTIIISTCHGASAPGF